ncbi:fluoride efflux transporter CrcB [Nocardioides dongkuii]|uniref:fluoride efflux transporter CrcB n=1 Tax=Nocardioides dongkuii TaxID=2760089 RepID=UPI0015FAD1AA|nr:fluoride efflux transporter CrcB [Nocardioides dongkuii]
MTFTLFLLLVLGGGTGAALRYVVDGLITSGTGKTAFPWSTATINLTGSFLLGFLTGLVASRVADPHISAVLITGLPGGYTTFSAASYETVQLVRDKRLGLAVGYGLGVLVVGVALALLGYVSGSRV